MKQLPDYKCTRKRMLLDAFVDQELSCTQHQDIVAHLENCAACRAEVDSITFLVKSLRQLPRATLSEDFLLRDLPNKISKIPLPCTRHKIVPRHNYNDNISVLAIRIWGCTAAAVIMFIGSLGFWHFTNYLDKSKLYHTVTPNYSQAEAQIALLEAAPSSLEQSDSITDSMGLVTDEDGLYAIKM
jgi:hypothetical protein